MEVSPVDLAHVAQPTKLTGTTKLQLQQPDVDGIPPPASAAELLGQHKEPMGIDCETLEVEDEDSEMEHTDEDGFPMVKDPSENILQDFNEALSGDLDFQGTFAFSKTYDDAPNPALRLEGVGTVGLPLSERDAKAVIENSIQAPFGKGERTVVDTEVRDTWEMDESKVQFQEPRWKSFMDRVVQEVCQALGVNVQASQPRCELYKLLVYETGSHFLPHVDTEKADGMFATIIVVLPSHFTGGDAHVSHGILKNVFNSSGPSLIKTTILSWYTDVMHEIKPITGGYRFALSYNLFHTTNSIRPSLSLIGDGIGTLRHILLSWKQQASDPDKIIYMLDHKYSRASLSASALKGKDAHIISALDSLSKELGFSLGLAHIEHCQAGQASNHGAGSYYRSRRRFRCGYDEDDEYGENVEMEEVHNRTTSVENLVDLDGKLISNYVNFDDETETIPANFAEYFEDERWDDQDFEGYQGNYGGDVNRFYRRSALVIWPGRTRLGNEEGNRRTVYGLQRLRTLDGSEPTNEEMGLFDYVRRSTAQRRDSRTTQTLCQVACQWGRVDLWLSTTSTIRGGQLAMILPVEDMARAITQFGYPKISKELRDIVLSDQSVMSRLGYLTGLAAWAHTQGGDPSHELVLSFVNDMRMFTFDNLPSVDASQLSFLTDEAMKYGGVQRLKKSILPQLHKDPVKTDVMQSYATYLHTEMKRLAPNAADQSLLKEIITKMLTSVLKLLDLFQVKAVTDPAYYSYRQPATTTLKGDPAIAMKFVAQCLESDNAAIAIAALKRMVDMTGQTQDIARARATTVLLPLIQLLSKDPKTKLSLPRLPLAGISEVAIPLVLQSIEAKGGKFTQDTICALLDSMVICGTPQVLTTAILPKVRSFKWDETSWKLWMEQLYSRRKAFTTAPEAESLVRIAVAEMAKLYAEKVSLPDTLPTNGHSYYGTRKAATILAVLDTCVDFGGQSALEVILKRVLAPQMTSEYLRNTLVPLLPDLCQLAHWKGMAISSEPFASTIRTIMNNWVNIILGMKPSEAAAQPLLARLQKYNCQDSNCVQVRKFLITPNAQHSMELERIGAPARKHIEKELQTHAYGAATFETVRTTPQGLTIRKHDALFRPALWRATQQEGVKLLKEIGQEGVIKAVWGDDYTTFIHKMNGIPTSTQTANQNINPHRSRPATTSTGTAVAGPSRTQPPLPRPAVLVGGVVPGVLVAQDANAHLGQQSTTRDGIATAATLGHAVSVTPAKRKFDAVIDLTSD
ncbi:hypothetical protein PM082_019806 [Marasmius tenuissimus]|nr:hypothetical protein PM082_019806 [Marasmius tenuissimus]